MNLGLKDKTVLISGSSRGIGRAIAEAFLAEGASVFVTGRHQKDLDLFLKEQVKENKRIRTFCGDLTDEKTVGKAIAAAVSAFGAIDCLIPNIGKIGRAHV